VSLSADGNTLAIGGPGDDDGNGAVWLFKFDPASRRWWEDSASPFIGTDSQNDDSPQQGTSVALSADASVLVSGAPSNVWGLGSFFVFYHDEAEGWYQDPYDPYIGKDFSITPYQGTSVSHHESSSSGSSSSKQKKVESYTEEGRIFSSHC